MLKIKNLSKFYGDRAILQDINLQILPGEVYGLLGPNGAGKTTMINIICSLLQPDSGAITIDGMPVSDATKSVIGIAPQNNLIYSVLTCEENLDFFATLYGLQGAEKAKRIRVCLEDVNLLDRARSRAETLSGGMIRRLNMAIALVHEPRLVILDEPTTGLDIESRYEIWELIERLRNQGTTLLLTTHLLEEAERLCQHIGILKDGRLLAEGSLEQLRRVIPAAEILLMHTPEEDRAIALAIEYGFTPRRYGKDLAFWLPEPKSLQEIVTLFAGIAIDSVAIQPVRLENIYMEITQSMPATVTRELAIQTSGLIDKSQLIPIPSKRSVPEI